MVANDNARSTLDVGSLALLLPRSHEPSILLLPPLNDHRAPIARLGAFEAQESPRSVRRITTVRFGFPVRYHERKEVDGGGFGAGEVRRGVDEVVGTGEGDLE